MTKLKNSSSCYRLLIAGGGTGGHILAGIAVAEAWKTQVGSEASLLFVGAAGGIEEKLVPRAKFQLKTLKMGSLNRVSLSRKLKTAVQLPFAFIRAGLILLSYRPHRVIGVGGYSSGPVVLIAAIFQKLGLLKCETAILEQNTVMGLTNRLLARVVNQIFTAFPLTKVGNDISVGVPVIVTGNPTRSSIRELSSATRDPFGIFIFGGSQGAFGINTLVLDALPFLSDLKGRLKLTHQTGERDYARVLEGHQKLGFQSAVEKFIYDMPTIYESSSLLICRAGSSTLSEIAAVGRASILIPLPTAADNHQEINARVFSDHAAAQLLIQKTATGEILAKLVRELIENPVQITNMENKVKEYHKPQAAERIVAALM